MTDNRSFSTVLFRYVSQTRGQTLPDIFGVNQFKKIYN